MTDIKTILLEANRMLSNHSPTARLDAEVLLAFTLKVNRSFLYAHDTDQVSDNLKQRYHDLCAMRREGHPIAYLTGVREFWSLPLCV
ncbi:MAG: protein-(glutamine-N5) methyltransferase, release factor-specific, partial [Legionellaceae bacterium]